MASRQVYDEHGCFFGYEPRECGEHRTVGDYRAWCFDCGEWCYPASPCIRCELPDTSSERHTEVPINQYLAVRDRFFWNDSLLARLNQNPEPANVARILSEWRHGFDGEDAVELIDGERTAQGVLMPDRDRGTP